MYTSEEDSLSYLPDPPDKPLPTDCCGTGCTPCVMDIYQKELESWQSLEAMTPTERATQRREMLGGQRRRDASVRRALSTTEFRSFVVRAIERVTMDTCVYTIALPDSSCLDYLPGQHCMLRTLDTAGCPVTRRYTPVSSPDKEGAFDVMIKLYKDGPMSEIIRGWVVGSVTEWKGMFGGFNYSPNKYKHLTMLACGTGLAPMMQVMRTIVENERDETCVHLIYSSPTQHTLLLKNTLDQYNAYWNVNITFALTRVTNEEVRIEPGLIRYGDKVRYGRLDCDALTTEVPRGSGDSFALICGTRSFDKDMINHLTKLGYTDSMIHKF